MNMRSPMDVQRTAAAAAHPVPDRHGSNLYSTDLQLEPLLRLYLPQQCMPTCNPTCSAWGIWLVAGWMSWH